MSAQSDIFTHAIEFFTAEEEEVRTAAAFCAGRDSMDGSVVVTH